MVKHQMPLMHNKQLVVKLAFTARYVFILEMLQDGDVVTTNQEMIWPVQ